MSLPVTLKLSLMTFCMAVASAAQAQPPCNADLDGDGYVGQTDLGVLLAAYGNGAGGDLDNDGDTDQADLGILLAAYDTYVTFDYGPIYDNAEAWQVGLESLGENGKLVLPEWKYLRIDRDLAAIRDFEPLLETETHSMSWPANQLLISRNDNGDLQEYYCLNDYYQVISEENIFDNLYLLTFAGKSNIPALAGIYSSLSAINYAEPNNIYGGSNYWVPEFLDNDIVRWDIDDGFMDCFDGCDCHRHYIFETDLAGNVTLIFYEEYGYSWCDFGG